MLGWEYPPFLAGGLGIHCYELTERLVRAGAAVDFYMPRIEGVSGPVKSPEGRPLRITQVDADPGVSPYGGRKQRYERAFTAAVSLYNARLVEAFKSWDADVLHAHDWITVPAALELRERTGLPLVLTMHSTEYDRSGGFYPQGWIEDIERRGVQGADRVIAVSRYTKALLQREYGVDPDRVTAVHNGIDVSKFAEARIRDYATERGTVLFLSRLTPQKCPIQFLQAAKRVLEVRPSTRFVVAGQGEMLAECIEFVLANGMADRVRFTGYVPDDELAEFYTRNEVYVLPSFSEPFGISVLEAMASGLPTIVSRTTGVGESLQHVLKADYWDIDEMADLILRLMDSPVLREALGQNGAREVRRFSWEKTARETLDVYRSASMRHRPMEIIA